MEETIWGGKGNNTGKRNKQKHTAVKMYHVTCKTKVDDWEGEREKSMSQHMCMREYLKCSTEVVQSKQIRKDITLGNFIEREILNL